MPPAQSDFLNYSSPMSLDSFGQSCGLTDISKTVFPYEKWTNTSDIENCKTFPIYADFKTLIIRKFDDQFIREFFSIANSKLKSKEFQTVQDIAIYYGFDSEDMKTLFILQDNMLLNTSENELFLTNKLHTSPSKYESSKIQFQTQCTNMLDYLKEYNLNDCRLLCSSIIKYAEGFLQQWNVNIHQSMSLPGVAERIAYKYFNPKSPPIFSFGEKFGLYNKQIRQQLHG